MTTHFFKKNQRADIAVLRRNSEEKSVSEQGTEFKMRSTWCWRALINWCRFPVWLFIHRAYYVRPLEIPHLLDKMHVCARMDKRIFTYWCVCNVCKWLKLSVMARRWKKVYEWCACAKLLPVHFLFLSSRQVRWLWTFVRRADF